MQDDVAAVHARIRALYAQKQSYGAQDDAAELARKSYADADLYDEIASLYARIGDKAQSASSTEMAKACRNAARVYEEAAADTRPWGEDARRLAIQLHAEACALRDQGDEEGAKRLFAEAMEAALRSTDKGPVVRIGPVYADGLRTSIRLVRQRPPAAVLPHLATCSRLRTHRVRAPRPRRRRSGVVRGARSPGRQDDDDLPSRRVARRPLGGSAMRLLAFTFVLVRGAERRSATFYARSEQSAREMAVAWAARRGWEVLASGTEAMP